VAVSGIAGAQAPERGNRPVSIELSMLGSYSSGVFDEGAAEIVAHDPARQRLFVVNASAATVDVLDISDPTSPELVATLETGSEVPGGTANSVAVRSDLVAVAVEADDKQAPGAVVFFDAADLGAGPTASVTVGALPDMLTFTPDGARLLVANEGEPSDDYSVDPVGSVSIIEVPATGAPTQAMTAGFEAWNDDVDALRSDGVRIFGPNASVAQDLEPEYIAVDEQSRTAYVVLQEANAYGVLDIHAGGFTDIIPFGLKDHSLPGNELDPSNQDGGIEIASWPVFGMYQPDAIDAYQVRGRTYLVTANEGDTREYETFVEFDRFRAVASGLDACPETPLATWLEESGRSVDELRGNTLLGRLNVTEVDAFGGTPADECLDQVHAFGARSFSIWAADGTQVFDSRADFERITADLLPDQFNSNNDDNDSFDSRSDDKGPEPEGVVLGKVAGRTYAFIGLERVGGIMVYDVTDPANATFVQYVDNRDFTEDAQLDDGSSNPAAGDLGPEGLAFIAAEDSATGRPMLAVGNEVSGTTTLFDIALTTPGNGPRR
jgi:hypothetical protein